LKPTYLNLIKNYIFGNVFLNMPMAVWEGGGFSSSFRCTTYNSRGAGEAVARLYLVFWTGCCGQKWRPCYVTQGVLCSARSSLMRYTDTKDCIQYRLYSLLFGTHVPRYCLTLCQLNRYGRKQLNTWEMETNDTINT